MARQERKTHRVLVIDDEADIRELLELTLIRMGLDVQTAENLAEARQLLKTNKFNLCLTDLRLPDGDGLDMVRFINEHYPTLPVAVITAFGSTENAVMALKAGAFDYLAKPVGLEQLRTLVKAALRVDEGKTTRSMPVLIGESQVIESVRQTIEKLAKNLAPVYISGESGSGKELAARLIHLKSARAAAPFVPVNCGAIPENLMESEFFGYKKGAFTGADSDRDGFFQAANGGTLFLDEVADLPLPMQVKLLRAIQEKCVRKVGQVKEENIDVRIICATHQNLKQCVEDQKFRQDLYYRLNVIELHMPSLRDRPEDILPLAQTLLERLYGDNVPELDPAAQAALRAYVFPGNVRELENILERAVALSDGKHITVEDLHLDSDLPESLPDAAAAGESLDDYLKRIEKSAISEALIETHGNRTAAARKLGISFRSLRYRLERLGLAVDD